MNNVIVASVQTFEKLRSMSSSNIKETMSRDFQLPMFFISQSNLVSELSGKSDLAIFSLFSRFLLQSK